MLSSILYPRVVGTGLMEALGLYRPMFQESCLALRYSSPPMPRIATIMIAVTICLLLCLLALTENHYAIALFPGQLDKTLNCKGVPRLGGGCVLTNESNSKRVDPVK
jgi:hypothetical protein